MSDLSPCKCGAPAAEHIRGEFHAGDETVEHVPEYADDYRVACSTFPACPRNGGWHKPTLKEVARAKAAWNEMNSINGGE